MLLSSKCLFWILCVEWGLRKNKWSASGKVHRSIEKRAAQKVTKSVGEGKYTNIKSKHELNLKKLCRERRSYVENEEVHVDVMLKMVCIVTSSDWMDNLIVRGQNKHKKSGVI